MPISTQDFPVEILSYTFACILSTGAPTTFPLALRLVCRRWRAVAEQTPEIWPALVTGHGIEWAKRAIELSKTIPLDVTLSADSAHGTTAERQALESLILAQLPRIRTLALPMDEVNAGHKFFLSGPMSMLEKLTVLGNWAHPLLNLYNGLLCTPPPKLTDLELRSARLSPTFPALMSPLTHLSLIHCSVWQNTDEIISTLTHLPRLQSFIWRRLGDFSAVEIQSSTQRHAQRVEMLDLVHVEMDNAFEVIMSVMSRIALPPTSCIILDADVGELDTNTFLLTLDGALLPHLKAVFPLTQERDCSGPGFTKLEVLGSDDQYGLTVRWSKPNLHRLGPAKIELALFGDHDLNEALVRIMSHMLAQWPGTAAAVSHFTLFHDELCEEDTTWRILFDHLQSISYLTTGGPAAESLNTALSEADEMQLFNLQKLVFRNADFDMFEYQSFINEMEDRRKDVNDPGSRVPRQLSFVNCYIMGDRVTRMDITLREAAGEEVAMYGKGVYDHDDQ